MSSDIREMQMTATMRRKRTAVRKAKVKYTNASKCRQGCAGPGAPCARWGHSLVQPLWETTWQFPTEFNLLFFIFLVVIEFLVFSPSFIEM